MPLSVQLVTSAPALGPIPLDAFIWVTFMAFTVILILAERESRGFNVTKRVLAFVFAIGTFVTGVEPMDFIIMYQNGTLAQQSVSLFGGPTGGGTGAVLLVVSIGLLVFSMLQILEILVQVMNRGKIEE